MKTATITKDEDFPVKVSYKGKTFWRTEKFGTHIASGESSAEYNNEETKGCEFRVWLRASGAIDVD